MLRQESNWFYRSFVIVTVVTLFRVVTLGFSQADLFVDEAQYWLWGQNFDFGYYSKPPLIAWVIRATTELAGSISAFWIRLPAPLFHGATALILAIWAEREFGARAAVWVAVSYITMPIVAVGSALISTDTIMAPFFAMGLLYYSKLLKDGGRRNALIAGAMVGLAIMAKYAGVYFLAGAALAAIFLPAYRISRSNTGLFLFAVILAISPNIYWNLLNGLTTLEHTADNIGWLRAGNSSPRLNVAGFAEFFLSQFLAMGPALFAAVLILAWKRPAGLRGLLLFSVPVIALVSLQALLAKANANWAFAAYFASVLVAVPWLLTQNVRWLWTNLAFGASITVLLPVMVIFAGPLSLDGERPLFSRYLGRDELSLRILDLAQKNSPVAIVASNRDVLADLFLTGRDQDVAIYSVAPKGRAGNYYQQNFPFPDDMTLNVLFVTSRSELVCDNRPLREMANFDDVGTAYETSALRAYLVPSECLQVIR